MYLNIYVKFICFFFILNSKGVRGATVSSTLNKSNLNSLGDSKINFTKEPRLVLSEHIDFVFFRLYHLLDKAPTEINSLRNLLRQELNASKGYREAWDEGTQLFEEKKKDLVGDGDDTPKEYHIALITYTIHDTPSDYPFYKEFNTETRNLCTGLNIDKFPFKSFFQLLRLAILSLNQKPKFMPPDTQLYRGVSVRYDFVASQEVAFQQFTSLSTNRTVAEIYSRNVPSI